MSDPTVTTLLDEWAHEKKLDADQRIELLLEFVEFDQGLDEEFARFLDKKSVEASKPAKRRTRSPVK